MKAFECMMGLALPLSAPQLKVAGINICCLSYWVATFRNQPISCMLHVANIKELGALLSENCSMICFGKKFQEHPVPTPLP